MYRSNDQNSLGFDPIYQTIAVYEPLSYVLFAKLRYDTAHEGEFAYIPGNREYFRNNRSCIELGISRNVFRDQFEIFRCLR